MTSITLKLSSLVIRTLSKPIANQIKAQAREHERFRRVCVSFAQTLHRIDMRLRLGLLQSSASIERQAAREAADLQIKKRKQQIPTVKTEAQMKADEAATVKEREKAAEPPKPPPTPRIRPLSEAKAIDTGANFISETFLFMVAGGLIVFESWRSRRKETSRREDVAERLNELEESEKAARLGLIALEKEILQLRAKYEKKAPREIHRVLPESIQAIDDEPESPQQQSIFEKLSSKIQWFRGASMETASSKLGPPPTNPSTSEPTPHGTK
ncbi:hypothetical protein LOZ57_001599 [Ophidiomyces ophidiicola]|uniref:uncharacterized protein n=1 Tax=Ophidiomyces ophidiicola TaxID=1387563 RepID=UPI0020C2B7AE|nr:uncharacterized protein LOZ57_001599 [Ophidiomyces ophidiicola]KAI1951049.1 hypothetical protein LOZ57_001599 [Ophidiomyces ophidiicola]KAI2060990.1 hypothetical protein LOZ43_001447 [Ophidiomyces ophidiicola]KAI2087587.1 hypothetical protein LOZ36_002726 [Ophidiomyces ophidiicola]